MTATAAPTTTTVLTKFADPLRIPPHLRADRADSVARFTLRTEGVSLRLHAQLPPTPLWTYEGHFPGPVLDLHRGQRARVTWENRTTTPYPAVDAFLADAPGNPSLAMNDPGIGLARPVKGVAALPAWQVTHLHGAVTGGNNDGWMENAVPHGDAQLSEYPNDQPAMTLWYHDHAMNITRLNVFAGLVGMYLLRDDEEEALGLPGGDREIPLIVCDRNLETDAAGRFTGRLLHKTTGTLPFVGPYTLVNGTIWPYLEVRPGWYRFRVLNASNARTYRLHLLDAGGAVVTGSAWLIGTDSGLLGAPLPVPADGLTLAPAERADVLVDFGAFPGQSLRLVNSAQAPFRGDPLPPGVKPGDPLPASRLPEPDVMEFRVADVPLTDTFRLPQTLSLSYYRLTHDRLPSDHMHRMLALAADADGTLGLWELGEVPASEAPTGAAEDGIIQVTDQDGVTTTYRRLARHFDDQLNWRARQDGWEVWKILNLSGILHPIHIHLTRFQPLSIDGYDTATFLQAQGGTAPGAPVAHLESLPIDPSLTGWKDVMRVPPGTMVTVAGQFRGASGRYMYHCHILEHEDAGMMREFSVMPGAVMDVGGMGGMGGMGGGSMGGR
ncbi:multicopper oxidase family protein [Streptacidiphilus anmyonensis]|uniref:multicopper oxidase family protein n=1 Tax=Streptacidiphilus anmyonensis TaxID=405782 RepID=UPI0005A79DA4|nr:multicopper oxidase domain-containing protein [Streptacidiphilus anmyonensis]